MEKQLILTLVVIFIVIGCEKENQGDLILVKGGPFKIENLSDFYIGKYEVTQKEWIEIMGSNPSQFKGANLPVEMVSWYDCVEYCNNRSLKEGLKPFYNIDKTKGDPQNKSEFDSLKWRVTINPEADGYRLPTESEWEYAASGGKESKGYTFSGGNDIDEVAWYWRNSGESILKGSWVWAEIKNNNCKTHPVGLKEPNELGIYDMSGNVREWCQEWFQDDETPQGYVRVQRGGGWLGGEYRCEISNQHSFEASGVGPDQGFRICRSAH